MSKFDRLWAYIGGQSLPTLTLSFSEIETIAGVPIDHSFLTAKRELLRYGFDVEKISMKEQTVRFVRLGMEKSQNIYK